MSSREMRLLLAEDDDGHSFLVQQNLKEGGFNSVIVRVNNGRDALDYIFRRGAYSGRLPGTPLLVLLDINLPLIDGIDVLREAKSHPAFARTPIIVLTTTDDPREIERCYELGCNSYITKPVNYDEFADTIRYLGRFLSIIQAPAEEIAS